VTDAAIAELAPALGVRAACDAVGAAQASYYRRHRSSPAPARSAPIPHRDRPQPRALSHAEQQAILHELHSDRFADLAPAEVWAILLDEGRYLGSISTFYRLLRQAGETRERRRQATHPTTVKPELVADAPNSTWSWDITKLHGPAKWTYFYLYVILDIYSRYVVGWMVAHRESAALAEVLIRQTCAKQAIGRDQLSIHADRGSSMTSKPVAFLPRIGAAGWQIPPMCEPVCWSRAERRRYAPYKGVSSYEHVTVDGRRSRTWRGATANPCWRRGRPRVTGPSTAREWSMR